MQSVLLTFNRSTVAALEAGLRGFLPGVDVKLWQVSPTQALLRAHLAAALKTSYPNGKAWAILESLRVVRCDDLDDAIAAQLVALRDVKAPTEYAVSRLMLHAQTHDWHLVRSGAVAAWDLVHGPDNINWQGVKVGQIDTGYTMHPAFKVGGKSWIDTKNAATFLEPPHSGEATLFPEELGGGRDNLRGQGAGHGTRIGATICGYAPNAPGGSFFGVAPKVPLLPVRICDSVWINNRQREFVDAVDYLLGHGVNVINVSLGIFVATIASELREAINKAYEAGVIMVCASGNIADPVVAPARLDRTLAVGGVKENGRPWEGSSYGAETDFCSYADGVRSAQVGRGPKYGYSDDREGTSYATAITSGAAALWLAHHGEQLRTKYQHRWQIVEAFRHVARTTARVPQGNWWVHTAFGTGILDIKALLDAALPEPASEPSAKA